MPDTYESVVNPPQRADTRSRQTIGLLLSRNLLGLLTLFLAASSAVAYFTATTLHLECERTSAQCVFGSTAVELRDVVGLELQDEGSVDPHVLPDESEGPHYRVVASLRDGSQIPASEQFFPDLAREQKIVADFKEFAFHELPRFSGAYGESQESCAVLAVIFSCLSFIAFGMQIDWRRIVRCNSRLS